MMDLPPGSILDLKGAVGSIGGSVDFVTSEDSPVKTASLVFKSISSKITISAGTTSPAFTTTTSPNRENGDAR